ncbi:MAG: Mrp/NBP35 family ATP-binding protein, partial [Tannerellaceae bacterium]|nr:Mrp/NBP35 family ATP-binding protein [Tannerellaceae bacterium]
LKLPLLGQIPLVQSIREGGDSGAPVALNPDSLTGAAFRALAETISRQVNLRNEQLPPTHRVSLSRG